MLQRFHVLGSLNEIDVYLGSPLNSYHLHRFLGYFEVIYPTAAIYHIGFVTLLVASRCAT